MSDCEAMLCEAIEALEAMRDGVFEDRAWPGVGELIDDANRYFETKGDD